MTDERRNLLARREIISGYITALERPAELLEICAGVEGDATALRAAVAGAFGVTEVVATAILDLQVRRFTPASLAQMRDELADCDRRLVGSD